MTNPSKNLIILADNDDYLRTTAKELFEQLGYEVQDYPDGMSALEALRSLSNEERARLIIVSDWVMPFDGIKFVGLAKQEFPEVPFMMWTSNMQSWEPRVMKKAGADHALKKLTTAEEWKNLQAELDKTLAAHQNNMQEPDGAKNPMDHATRNQNQTLPKRP